MGDFARRVIRHHRRRGRRGLPWQRPRTLYRVWVSEIMLQQTRVETAAPYFRRFLRAYPSVKRLAEAPLDEVLERWAGLGYYARARNLHRAARMLRAAGGRLPRTVADWRRLPGVGPSTAGAIVSLALDRPAVMLDANARRVIARHQGLDPDADAALWRRAAELLPARDAADYTQGLMDLGAQCCTARAPDCPHCPLRADCRHAAGDRPARAARPKAAVPRRARWLLMLRSGGKVLLQPRPPAGIWGGLWSLPEFGGRAAARRWAEARAGALDWTAGAPLRHRLSHRELVLRPLCAEVGRARRAAFGGAGRWRDPENPGVGVPAPVARLLLELDDFFNSATQSNSTARVL